MDGTGEYATIETENAERRTMDNQEGPTRNIQQAKRSVGRIMCMMQSDVQRRDRDAVDKMQYGIVV